MADKQEIRRIVEGYAASGNDATRVLPETGHLSHDASILAAGAKEKAEAG